PLTHPSSATLPATVRPAGARRSLASRRVADLGHNYFDHLDALIARARRRHGDVIDLSKGNPDLTTPDHIVRAAQDAVGDPGNQAYPPFLAKRSVREAIAEAYLRDHGVQLDPDTQVTAFHGAHEALVALPWALLDAGETIIIPDPCYPPYLDAARLAGVEVARVALEESLGYQPDPAGLAEALGGAAMLLLNYPNNPTGAVATPRTWESVLEAAAPHGTLVVNDFAYSSLDFAHDAAYSLLSSLSSLSGDTGEGRALEISTLSKTHSMAGWRFGYAAGDAEAIAALRAYQSVAFSTIFGAVQDAAEAALRGDQDCVGRIAATYAHRRESVVAGLRRQGWHVAATPGTFFVWVRARGTGDGEALAERLLEEAHVAVAPGEGFGEQGRGWFRLSLVHDQDTLAEALRRLEEWSRAQGRSQV
ncbi:MAG: aminotransferase class I/II-fold pyridoxal phosphate-dependent enzyme, partial [Propionibacterium sp.]|nr:aminotransferase class I/II-fold pyridoxal phosphate-dependent enzyme [Propionibacterium sp.]